MPRELPLGISHVPLSAEASKRLWLQRDFEAEIAIVADAQDMNMRRVSLRYGELNFWRYENAKYEYNDQLGLVRV